MAFSKISDHVYIQKMEVIFWECFVEISEVCTHPNSSSGLCYRYQILNPLDIVYWSDKTHV